LSGEAYAELKGVMWLFRKPWVTLDDEQQRKMLLLFGYAPVLKQVYLLREILTGIFERPLKKS